MKPEKPGGQKKGRLTTARNQNQIVGLVNRLPDYLDHADPVSGWMNDRSLGQAEIFSR
jgi:hypothetical protein